MFLNFGCLYFILDDHTSVINELELPLSYPHDANITCLAIFLTLFRPKQKIISAPYPPPHPYTVTVHSLWQTWLANCQSMLAYYIIIIAQVSTNCCFSIHCLYASVPFTELGVYITHTQKNPHAQIFT